MGEDFEVTPLPLFREWKVKFYAWYCKNVLPSLPPPLYTPLLTDIFIRPTNCLECMWGARSRHPWWGWHPRCYFHSGFSSYNYNVRRKVMVQIEEPVSFFLKPLWRKSFQCVFAEQTYHNSNSYWKSHIFLHIILVSGLDKVVLYARNYYSTSNSTIVFRHSAESCVICAGNFKFIYKSNKFFFLYILMLKSILKLNYIH